MGMQPNERDSVSVLWKGQHYLLLKNIVIYSGDLSKERCLMLGGAELGVWAEDRLGGL